MMNEDWYDKFVQDARENIAAVGKPSVWKLRQEGVDVLDDNGKDISNSQYGKLREESPNWKGGLCDDRQAYLTMKARETRAKYKAQGLKWNGQPYAN